MDAIQLYPIGTYSTGRFDESAAEISAYDSTTQRLFVVNADAVTVDVLDISDPTNPIKIGEIDASAFGGVANSVSVKNGVVAVAIEAEQKTDSGKVVFFDSNGDFSTSLNEVTVGALPDMLTFTSDGNKVIVANEGEPDGEIDPVGSVSIVDISNGVENATVSTAEFTPFNGREDDLRADGVRIFPNKTVAEDVEPEFLALSNDDSKAYVTLQENNAIAIIDIETATVEGIVPLGLKNHNTGLAELETFDFTNRGNIDNGGDDLLTSTGESIELGGFSGLWYDGVNSENGNLKFLTVPDRGPNGDADGNDRPFLLPNYQARVVEFELNEITGEIIITNEILLTRTKDSTTLPITGLPNIPNVDRRAVDASGNPVQNNLAGLENFDVFNLNGQEEADNAVYDPFGADLEGIIRVADNSFWMVDEYRPAIYHFDENGQLINRFVPEGTAEDANIANNDTTNYQAGDFGSETLPSEYLNRRANRGFEGMAFDSDNGILYAFIQTPLSNPDRNAGDNSSVIRMLGIDPSSGNPVAEYVYLLQKPDVGNNVDKIGDAVYAGDGLFYVMERDSSLDSTAQKFVFQVDLIGATNLLAENAPDLLEGKTLEEHTPDELADLGINVANKIKVTNLPSLGYLPSDKPEGLAILDDGRLAVLNDNDFGLEEGAEAVQLGLIDFSQSSKLDPSDRDDGINIDNFPVFGMFMPDAIASFEIDGVSYYIIANEGDDRGDADEEGIGDAIRLKDLGDVVSYDRNGLSLADNFDPSIEEDENLGRLTISSIDGDLDGDGELERLQSYGTRSFSVLDANGNIVFDSGDQFGQIIAAQLPEEFNSTNDANQSFENRSDNKGPEPEGVTIGVIDGKTYAFIGLERVGGIMVYDVTNPVEPEFANYINNRDFSITFNEDEEGDPDPSDSQLAAAGDLGPEGLVFISAEDSPNGLPLLVVGNEVSGTTTIFEINMPDDGLDVSGTDGDDTLEGENGGDLLLGNQGSDRIIGFRGDDTLYGGKDNDSIFGDNSNDIIFGDLGDDFLNGNKNDDNVNGGDGDDTVYGGRNNDTVTGDNGEDSVFGDLGNDFVNGNEGDDNVNGGEGNDSVYGGQDNDSVFGNDGEDFVSGDLGDDFLNGNKDNDNVEGGDGDDTIHGGQDNDTLIGGDGSDLLYGDLGDDLLTGGEDDDIFVIAQGQGTDTITDFVDGVDFIGLANGLTFNDLSFSGSDINLAQEVLVSLTGIDTTSLTSDDFVVV